MATRVTIEGSREALDELLIQLGHIDEADVDASANRALRVRLKENQSPELDFAVEEIW